MQKFTDVMAETTVLSESMGYRDIFGKVVSHEDALRKSVVDGLTSIEMDAKGVSEKSFGAIDGIVELCRWVVDDEVMTAAQEHYESGSRMELFYEQLWDERMRLPVSEAVSTDYEWSKVNEIDPDIDRKSYEDDIIGRIHRLHKVSPENKELAKSLVMFGTEAKSGVITGLQLPPDFQKRLDDEGLPSGFRVGVDGKGWFVHTHRGRCKSRESLNDIPDKDIKFIDSTG